jgi:hypothetical protein
MLYAGIEALFGRNRDGHRKKKLFHFHRRHEDEDDDIAKCFSDKPHLEKTLNHGSTFAFAAMQGWRSTMEDKHKHLISLDNYSWKFWSYFAIFDGHNGKIKMKYLKKKRFLFSRYCYSKQCFEST